MVPPRDYYNRRHGQAGQAPRLPLTDVARQVAAAYKTIDANGYLQRSFGYDCVDAGDVMLDADSGSHEQLHAEVRPDLSGHG